MAVDWTARDLSLACTEEQFICARDICHNETGDTVGVLFELHRICCFQIPQLDAAIVMPYIATLILQGTRLLC